MSHNFHCTRASNVGGGLDFGVVTSRKTMAPARKKGGGLDFDFQIWNNHDRHKGDKCCWSCATVSSSATMRSSRLLLMPVCMDRSRAVCSNRAEHGDVRAKNAARNQLESSLLRSGEHNVVSAFWAPLGCCRGDTLLHCSTRGGSQCEPLHQKNQLALVPQQEADHRTVSFSVRRLRGFRQVVQH